MRLFRFKTMLILALAAGCSSDKSEISVSIGTVFGKSESKLRPSPEKKEVEEGAEGALKTTSILRNRCQSCHAEITNLVALVSDEKVMPGYPKKSLLLKQIKSGAMPPSEKLPADEVAVIEDWIKKGALSIDNESERGFITETSLYEAAADDLLELAEDDRPHIRYLSLTHLYNASAARDLLDTAGEGLSKLMNSLSWEKDVAPLTAIDEPRTIFRVDLRAYGWTATQWDDLVRSYPYQVIPADGKALSVLQADTKASVPVLRGDWFMFTASRAPLYYRLLKMPATYSELQTKLQLDTAANIAAKDVIRAGFDDSGVSKMHRVVERHALPDGFFWRSYEFGTKEKDQDVFRLPLGPVTAARPAAAPGGKDGKEGANLQGILKGRSGDQDLEKGREGKEGGGLLGAPEAAFREDGGEFLFTLPNKMLAYYLAAANDQRLDKVPVDEGEPEIVAGASCMGCHAGGPIPKTDKVRGKARDTAELAAHLATIETIYKPVGEFQKVIDGDAASFKEALKAAGLDLVKRKKDPVARIVVSYPLSLSFAQAAAELGVDRKTLRDALDKDAALAEIASRFQGNAIARDDFKAAFPALMTALKGEVP